ncbi:hypothetical protein [Streptosporangium sp. NBC_01756]|uniref:hypothetical protein n=1 Tax=Streptosporangium sp. NBC_01756 TaxID=2975950 RepID=UPI002DDC2300|nr:hypothetical protein [Streptosporangium sp. NBC_01756]WSC85620.1 hypothetical protein OIE48_35490 [Streptosporangium sp. NBC_01756]
MPDCIGAPTPASNTPSGQAIGTRRRSVPPTPESGRHIRRATPPISRFTRISNQWLRDEQLSWKARGLLGWLSSHAAGFRVSEKSIICAAPDGRDATRAAIRELETCGYLVRERDRGRDGRLGGVDYILCDPWAPRPHPEGTAPTEDTAPAPTTTSIPVPVPVPNPTATPIPVPVPVPRAIRPSPTTENPPLAATSTNTVNPQVTTYDGKTNVGKPTPIRRTDKQEDQHPEKTRKALPLLAAGERADRNARDAATTPAAKPEERTRIAATVLGLLPGHYRHTPPWLRSRLLKKITEALAHYAPEAIADYCAKFAADPAFGHYEHLRRFDDTLRKLAADIADGTACPGCGRDPRHPFCTAATEGAGSATASAVGSRPPAGPAVDVRGGGGDAREAVGYGEGGQQVVPLYDHWSVGLQVVAHDDPRSVGLQVIARDRVHRGDECLRDGDLQIGDAVRR